MRPLWYVCCGHAGKVYLLEDEVWKYGVTCESNPTDRYAGDFYSKNNVRMEIQFSGNRVNCEIEEKRKLYYYPSLPENTKRLPNERLILPAGNCKLQ